MRRRVRMGLSSALLLTLGGCGTAVNFASLPDHAAPKRVYGGVALDRQWASQFFAEAVEGPPVEDAAWHNKLLAGSFAFGCGLCVLAADLPLSLVMDTLTLPATIPAAVARQNQVIEWADRDSNLETLAKTLATPPDAAASQPAEKAADNPPMRQ